MTCDATAPNPANGAIGNKIHLLNGSIVQVTDPYVFASPLLTSVIVNSNGTLNADAGSFVLDTVVGGTAVEGGVGSQLSVSGTVDAQHDNSRGVQLDAGASLRLNAGGLIETIGNGGPFLNKSAAIAVAGDGASIDLAGTVQTSGQNASAIVAGTTDPVGGELVFHDAAITVGSSGSIATTGANSYAILMADSSVTNGGTITTFGNGSTAIVQTGSDGTGSIINNGTIVTHGSGAAAIVATDPVKVSIGGTGSVSTNGSDASGITASSAGDASVAQTSVSTIGDRSLGVSVVSTGGTATVTLVNASTSGNDSTAIYASGANAVVNVSGAVSTVGTYAGFSGTNGISAIATIGTATVTNSGSVNVAGENTTGIYLMGAKGVTLNGGGAINATGNGALGVLAEAMTGNVDIETGTITTSGYFGNGIQSTADAGEIRISAGDITTTGDRASGIVATAATGVTVDAATVSTSGATPDGLNSYGIYAFSTGGTVSVKADSVTATGANAEAIYAASQTGDALVDAGSASSSGAGVSAISAIGLGVASVRVGDVSAMSAPAVQALGGASATVTLDGTARSGNGPAIVIGSLGSATLNIGLGGGLTQAGAGAALYSAVSSVVNNEGTIVGDGSAPILQAGPPSVLGYPGTTAGALTFNNGGSFVGRIGFTAGNDTINNSGRFDARFNEDFGAGQNVFNNTGTITVGMTGVPVSASFANLQTFNNSGIIDLRNGVAGDQLTIPGTFNGTGNSTIAVDVDTGSTGTKADVLHLGAATGTTRIELAVAGNQALFTSGVTLVTVGTPTAATAFALSPTTQASGFVHYALAYDAGAQSFQLVGTPSAAAYGMGAIAEGAGQIWYKSADAVSAHLTAVRGAGDSVSADSKNGVWLQVYGQNDDRRQHILYGDVDADTGFAQDSFGSQLGWDIGASGQKIGALLGITGGYQSSRISLAGSDNHAEFDTVNIGAYIALKAGPLFVNGLGKFDHYWGHTGSTVLGYADKLNGNAYGGQIEAGARLGEDSLFFEPIAAIAYVHTSLDDIHGLGTTFDFGNFDGLRGKAGLRIGGTGQIAGQAITLYASGEAVHDFEGRDRIGVSNAGGLVDFRTERLPTYGKGTIGVTITSASRVSGFVEGFGDAGKGYHGGGGRAGLSFKL